MLDENALCLLKVGLQLAGLRGLRRITSLSTALHADGCQNDGE